MTDGRLPSSIRAAFAHARGAYPLECCGWMVAPRAQDGGEAALGLDSEDGADRFHEGIAPTPGPRADRFHEGIAPGPAGSAHADRSSFSLDDVGALRELERACRALPAGQIWLYHSHPDGRAAWSVDDDLHWSTPFGPLWGVQHVVIAVSADAVVGAVRVAWEPARGRFIERWRWAGSWS
jgi:proteasome lid subunit RPN8/RPN11